MAVITAAPPAPGTSLVDVVRYYTDVARAELGESWDLELIPLQGKNPRVNGTGWQDLASAEPQAVVDQLKRTAGRANGLGALMNRHIAFDVDNASALPRGLATVFEAGLVNVTREDRAHYIFRVPRGLRFGGSKVKLDPAFGVTAKWGEVKAWNSQVRIWSPNSDGSHVALRPGLVPDLPAVLTGLLLPPLAPGDMASDAELDDFLAEHTAETRPGWLDADLDRFAHDLSEMSKYEAMVRRQIQLAVNVAAGLYSGARAYDALLTAYRAACASDHDWDEGERVAKYRTAWRGAVAKVTRDPDLIASVEEKRRGGGTMVSWDPEHDEADALLAEWLGDWAAHLGMAVGDSGARVYSGAEMLELLTAPDAEGDREPAREPESLPEARNGDSGMETPGPEVRGLGGSEEETRGKVPAPSEPEPISFDSEDSDDEAEAPPSKYDAYRAKLLGTDDGRAAILQELKKRVVIDVARDEYRLMVGQGPITGMTLDLDGCDDEDDAPSLMPLAGRPDGMGLFYPDAVTNVIGDKAAGKSWLLMWMVLYEIRRGKRAAWLDWEMSAKRCTRRLKQLGATQADLNKLTYFSMSKGTFEDARPDLMRMPRGSIIVVDSVSRALASEAGVTGEGGENDNTAFVAWLARVASVRAAMDGAMFLIEHTGHTNKHRSRGASAKGQQADSEFTMTVVQSWNREESGWAALTCRKDRTGHLIEDRPAYGAFFSPLGDGNLAVEVRELTEWEAVFAGRAEMDEDDKKRMEREEKKAVARSAAEESLTERIIAQLGAGPMSRAGLADALRAHKKVLNPLIAELIEEGRLIGIGAAGRFAQVALPGTAVADDE